MTVEWTVNIGRYYGGGDIELPIPGWGGANWLFAGSTGSGKTTAIKVACAEMARKYGSAIQFAVADPHMVGFPAFKLRAAMLAFGWNHALPLLKQMRAEMRGRYKVMFKEGIEEWTPEVAHIVGPYLVVIVDELAAVTMAPKPQAERVGVSAPPSAEKILISLAQEIRKTGGGLILATQTPTVDVITNLVRQQCPIRWCGRTKNVDQTKAVLDTKIHAAHDIPARGAQGVCFVDDGLSIRRGRSDGIDSLTFAAMSKRFASDRHDFGWKHVLQPFDDMASEAEEGTA